jgi:hypothetical protein
MLTFTLAKSMVYRVGRMRNDDGSAADPWALPDWRYAPFTGRFADPEADPHRIRYVGLGKYGAFVDRHV